MSDQKKECVCASSDLLAKTLEAMSELTKTMCEQNKLMAQIVDQNNNLIARLESMLDEDDEQKKKFSGYLDDSYG